MNFMKLYRKELFCIVAVVALYLSFAFGNFWGQREMEIQKNAEEISKLQQAQEEMDQKLAELQSQMTQSTYLDKLDTYVDVFEDLKDYRSNFDKSSKEEVALAKKFDALIEKCVDRAISEDCSAESSVIQPISIEDIQKEGDIYLENWLENAYDITDEYQYSYSVNYVISTNLEEIEEFYLENPGSDQTFENMCLLSEKCDANMSYWKYDWK